MTVKWVFFDPADSSSYTFEINPNEMGTPYPQNTTTKGTFSYVDGEIRSTRRLPPPVEWSFGGILRTKTQYDAFVTWLNKPNRVHVTDHLSRTFVIRITDFDAEPRQATAQTPEWRYKYTVKALVYGAL